jgi:hypothetical protein
MKTSRFVSLTPYCIVEYMFEPLGSTNFYTDDFILLQNEHEDLRQIVNDDSSYLTTKNIKDLSVVPIGKNKFVYIDSEKNPNYLTFDPKITETLISGYNVIMDQVRFHFISGFDFDDFKALILSVKHTENTGKSNLFANILLAPETIAELIVFNPRPLFLGNGLFDRYIDILVPSIKNINEDFKTSLTPNSTFVAAITPGQTSPIGFIYNNQISIGIGECGIRNTLTTNISETYEVFEITEFFEAQVSQSNEFDAVGAYINESINGDYLEFYLTFNSSFPEDLIAILNRRNPADDWIIVHQLSIFEQVGTSFINTSRFVFFQEENFDEPNLFRPVLKNANIAVSMTVDYIARLTNRSNGEQIIRESSFSLISPKKYGKTLINLPILDKPRSQTVYNKLIQKNFDQTSLFIEPSLAFGFNPVDQVSAPSSRVEYVPIFFTNNNISISNSSGLNKVNDVFDEVIFSQGKLRFILSPFDNVLKFKIYTKNTNSSEPSQIPLDLNINSSKYRIVFETNSGKVSIDNANDSKIENLSFGSIVFNISKKNSEIILQSQNRAMYIVSVSQDGKETLIYSGEWRRTSEQADVDLAIEEARKNSSDTIIKRLTQLEEKANVQINLAALQDARSKVDPIKEIAVTPVVNKFGIQLPKGVKPTSSNLDVGQNSGGQNKIDVGQNSGGSNKLNLK